MNEYIDRESSSVLCFFNMKTDTWSYLKVRPYTVLMKIREQEI